MARDEYPNLQALIFDITSSVRDQLDVLRNENAASASKATDEAIASTMNFRQIATDIFKRETTDPNSDQAAEILSSLDSTNAIGTTVLSIYGEAPRHRNLYTSLQQPLDGVVRSIRDTTLPAGVKTTKAFPYFFPPMSDKDKKTKTLGELFPAPRNLPSLQPPKAPKSTTKGVQVGWHRPELTEKSKYRVGSFFSQPLSTGRWLDYSNAAPPAKIMTRQHERKLSLAGAKPSTSDLETSELEALFRGAFSSFAPSKDDSAAMVSSGLISQTMWWQKVGRRSFDRLIETDGSDEAEMHGDKEAGGENSAEPVIEIDEAVINEALNEWDDELLDPSLEKACCPKKSTAEKDSDDILQEVSDLIQTLISYQKNRNLSLPPPATQSRHMGDPAHSDMLTSGTPAQPGEEETATYDALKAQLALIIQTLPPYAVARLNSDKLEELNISTKMEIRTDEYQGVMEEDEAAARAKAAAAASARPTTHRSNSSATSVPPFGQQYPSSTRPSMPTSQYYNQQTPGRPPPNMQRPPPPMQPAYNQRPPSSTGYRPPAGQYPGANYSQHLARSPAPAYQQPGFANTPPQNRPHYPPYQNHHPPSNNTPQTRFQSYTPSNPPPHAYQPPQQYQPQHQQPGTPSHAPHFNQYQNSPSGMPARTASPHVPPPHQHGQFPAQGYAPTGTPTRQPSFGGQPNVGNNQPQRYYPPAGSPQMMNQQPNQANNPNFHTSLQPHQVQQAMDQAKARFEIQKSAQRTNEGARNSFSAHGQHMPPHTGGSIHAASPSPIPQGRSPSVPTVNGAPNGGAPPAPREA